MPFCGDIFLQKKESRKSNPLFKPQRQERHVADGVATRRLHLGVEGAGHDVDGQLHDSGVVGQGGAFANCAKWWAVGGSSSLSSRKTTELIPIVGTAGAHKSQITQRAFLS